MIQDTINNFMPINFKSYQMGKVLEKYLTKMNPRNYLKPE